MRFGGEKSLVSAVRNLICSYTKMINDSNKNLMKSRRISKCLTCSIKTKYFYFWRIKKKDSRNNSRIWEDLTSNNNLYKRGYFYSLDDFLLILFALPPPKTNPPSSFSLYKNNSYAGTVSNSYTTVSIPRSKI
jgi:hypothetical protein